MPATSQDYGPLDMDLHVADGSHRTDPPASSQESLAEWQARRLAHLDRHISDAQASNVTLRDEPLLRTLADDVSRVTEGKIFLIEKRGRGETACYIFAHLPGTFTREDAIREMNRIIRSADERGL